MLSHSFAPLCQPRRVERGHSGDPCPRGRVAGRRARCDGIERGESILRTAVAAGVFDPLVLQMVAVGEETGEVDALMAEVADMYEREVTVEVEGLTAKLEPVLLVIMGVLVLILALGVFLPMWDLASAARGVSGGAR